jgi:hypothetical protein
MDRRTPGRLGWIGEAAMRVIFILSTQNGVGKTMIAANVGGIMADACQLRRCLAVVVLVRRMPTRTL